MKILIVINSLSTGGAERQVIEDANMLVANGYSVTVAFGAQELLLPQLNKDVKVFRLNTESEIKAIYKIVFHLLSNRYDVIISHMFWANKVTAVAGKITGHKILLFEHGLGMWRKGKHLVIVRKIAKWSTYVVTCSKLNMDLKINREGISSEKLKVIPNSFKKIEYKKEKIEDPSTLFKIGFAGRFNAVKQLPLLIDVASIMRNTTDNFRFILFGEGTTKKEMEEKIAQKGLEKNFDLPGYVKDPQNKLVNFDAFVLPSRIEDFSLALLEASSVGLPCVTFDVGGNSEIILNNKTGFVIEPYDLNKFADKLIWLMNNEDKRKNMGKAAKKWVNDEFNEEKRLERLQKIIKQTI